MALLVTALLVITPIKGGPPPTAPLKGGPPDAPAAPAPPRTLTGETPDVVMHGAAALRGHHDPNATLTLHIGLAVHNSAQLDAIIAAASNPASPQYGHYLTRAQYRAQFAPTDQEVQAVQDWATGVGLTVQSVSPDHLLVTVGGTTSQVEHALGVTINQYSLPDRTFFSNDRDPVVPGNLDIRAISGLSTATQVHTTLHYVHDMQNCPTGPFSSVPCYDPWDFISAYNTAHVGSGTGQSIGLTLWGAPVQQSDLHAFSQQTNTPEIISGQAGDNGIDWLQVGTTNNYGTNDLTETAMDVEYAHGVAPNSHLRYYLADCVDNSSTGHCDVSIVGLETAVDDAANDPSLHVVSNSWSVGEATPGDPFISNINAALQYAASVGTTFYFSTGDNGANSECPQSNPTCGQPVFPADSPYVVAVGGTTLHTDTNSDWSSESAWSGSGGGCSTVMVRPWWQTGVGAATCAGRAEPDVAADADPNTGAYVYVNGSAFAEGGTSLAAPLWAGMAADLDRYLAANGRALMGFAAPAIYQLANNGTTYARDFHDVQSGNNGYPAGPGWDEVTGWGSPDLANLAADWPATINAPPTGAILTLPTQTSADGCTDNTLPANDDGSTGIVALPFTANFFGQNYGALYVNNNGNVTFDSPLGTYTPFPLTNTSHVIIAPFFGDVDTRGTGSSLVTYGATTYANLPAFCVDWVNVGYYNRHTDKLNSFQLVLISRPDRNPGDFDIMFNYNQIQWETGDASGGSGGFGGNSARVGYSNGVDTSFELPGSAVNGAFLDWNAATGLVNNNRNSTQPGRYLFAVQNGVAPTGGSISGGVFAHSDAPANALAGAFVQVCGTSGFCQTTSTNDSGQYTVSGLPDGQYTVTAFPPGGSALFQGSIGPLTLIGDPTLIGQDIVLNGPTPPPPGTTITNIGTGDGGLPIVFWGDPLTLTTQGCAGGTAGYQILQNGSVIRSGGMTEGPAGTYTATIAPLMPVHGDAHVNIAINCPDATTTTTPFDIYIDPSGTVQTVAGVPVAGATVTLYRSDSSSGPFAPVPNGSGLMSLVNRNNPDVTDAAGHFGWDVVAGFYKVRATKAGCVSPADSTQSYVDSSVLTVPPAVTNLVLTLDCNPTSPTNTPTNTATPTNVPTNTATPTNTPVPPTTTPLPSTNTPVPPTSTSTPVPPTATPTIRGTPAPISAVQAASCLSPQLALGLARRSVVGGNSLPLNIHTAAFARVSLALQVAGSKVMLTGHGKHRKRVKQTIVLYRVARQETADARGQIADRLPITYKPTKAALADLTVMARTACGASARQSAHVMIQPPRSLPLAFRLAQRSVAGGSILTLNVSTAPRARVSVTLQAVATKLVTTGKGTHRKRVAQTVVLYRITRAGTADARGHFIGRLPVGYKPARPVPATLVVTARTSSGAATSSTQVTIQPPRRHRH